MNDDDEETPEPQPEPPAVHHPEDDDDGRKPVEVWAQDNELGPILHEPGRDPRDNPHHWKFTAAKALRKWQDGQLVTEEEFDAAIAEVSSTTIR
jgi:hypothetical protein